MQFRWRLITRKSLKFWIVWSYNLNCEQETNLKYCNYGVTARGTISHSNNRWANINRRDLASSICIEFWIKLKLYYMGEMEGQKKKRRRKQARTQNNRNTNSREISKQIIYMFIKNKKNYTDDVSSNSSGDYGLAMMKCSRVRLQGLRTPANMPEI